MSIKYLNFLGLFQNIRAYLKGFIILTYFLIFSPKKSENLMFLHKKKLNYYTEKFWDRFAIPKLEFIRFCFNYPRTSQVALTSSGISFASAEIRTVNLTSDAFASASILSMKAARPLKPSGQILNVESIRISVTS